jgi:hypothetical protein
MWVIERAIQFYFALAQLSAQRGRLKGRLTEDGLP